MLFMHCSGVIEGMERIRACVVGATGFAGVEVCRIVLGHPSMELAMATDRKAAGTRLADVYPAFEGATDLVLSLPEPEAIAQNADVAFLAVPHTASLAITPQLLSLGVTVIDLSADYRTRVVDYMFSEYEKGRTPNPDVLCNREIKFRAFLDYALKLGASRMATGHFVQSEVRNGHPVLLKGADANKDQSYFLYMLKERQLARALFPVGGMTKAQVRAVAEENGLSTSKKKARNTSRMELVKMMTLLVTV